MIRLLVPAVAMTLYATAAHACGPDAPPTDAVTYGLSCESFWDTMTSTSTFDTGNTKAQGYNWYPNTNWTGAAVSPLGGWGGNVSPTYSGDYTIGAGGLLMDPATNNYPISLWSSCVQTSNSAGYTGTVFQGTFYVDITYTYSGTPSQQWAALWMEPTEFLTGGITSTPIPFTELDLMESLYGRQLHNWQSISGTVTEYQSYGAVNAVSPAGTMVVQPSDNGGTIGLVKRYNNDVLVDTLQAGPTISPIGQSGPTGDGVGAFQQVFTGHYCLFLTTGPGQSLTVTSVKVWTKPIIPGAGRRGMFR